MPVSLLPAVETSKSTVLDVYVMFSGLTTEISVTNVSAACTVGIFIKTAKRLNSKADTNNKLNVFLLTLKS
jgi:hypothetical protein